MSTRLWLRIENRETMHKSKDSYIPMDGGLRRGRFGWENFEIYVETVDSISRKCGLRANILSDLSSLSISLKLSLYIFLYSSPPSSQQLARCFRNRAAFQPHSFLLAFILLFFYMKRRPHSALIALPSAFFSNHPCRVI